MFEWYEMDCETSAEGNMRYIKILSTLIEKLENPQEQTGTVEMWKNVKECLERL